MSDTVLTYLLGALVVAVPMLLYLRSLKKSEARAREAKEKGKLYSDGPNPSIRTSTPPTASAASLAPPSAPRATCWRCSAARLSS